VEVERAWSSKPVVRQAVGWATSIMARGEMVLSPLSVDVIFQGIERRYHARKPLHWWRKTGWSWQELIF
jgi:hypothetical protein